MSKFIEINDAIAEVMRLTGKSRRQAKAMMAEAIRKGEWKVGRAFKASKTTLETAQLTDEQIADLLEGKK